MIQRIAGIAVTTIAFVFGLNVIAPSQLAVVSAQEKKKEKNPLEGKKGTFIGTLVSKEKGGIEVKAPGDEKPRRFVPHWRGGQPAKGGGPDKAMLKVFSELKIGSRIEVEWVFEERFRAEKVTVLKAPAKDKDK